MSINHPTPADQEGMLTLWQEAFGDSRAFVEMFFNTGFSFDRSMICKENHQVVAALYWFDCLWNDKKVAYLYAIATKKEHRGKGICHALMEHTHQALKEQDYAGAILVPAEKTLEAFYGKMSYKRIAPGEFSGDVLQKNDSLEKITPEEYLSLRQQYLPQGGVQHTLPAMGYLGTFANFYRFPGGICCGDPALPMEYLPGYPSDLAMYLPLTEDRTLPAYFALSMA